jgi:hypothetical protein
MESDSEGSLQDFIDDGGETTESSSDSSSDESDKQNVKEGEKRNRKPVSRNMRRTRNDGPVEGEHVVFIAKGPDVSGSTRTYLQSVLSGWFFFRCLRSGI